MKWKAPFSAARRAPALLFLLLTSFVAVGRAELPPSAYKAQQEKAPESLVVRVSSVKTEEADEPQLIRVAVTVEARVVRVNRTRSGLKRGDVILIRYVHRRYKTPRAGPSEVPVLEKGETYPAYLSRIGRGRGYAPAAGGYSFSEVR